MAAIVDVLSKLLDRTEQGRVVWKTTAIETTFVAVVGNLSVMISNINQYSSTVLTVLNEEGQAIETLDSSYREGRDFEEQLHSLHDKARRFALNVDAQLGQLVEELDRESMAS